MTVVRELLINFGAKIDQSKLKAADSKIKSFAKNVKKILAASLVLGVAVKVGGAIRDMTRLASGVEEAMNVINESFGKNAESVLSWSESFGKAAGRNKYELQNTAGVIGALLNPMLDGNQEAAARMSKGLAELTTDLASFFNTADNDALVALRSAIAGELMPMRRFGVNMTEAALKAFALSKGITKNVKDMTNLEKTTLRYNFLMAKTKNAQGDAIRTSESYANKTKAMEGAITELKTEVGKGLLPVMTAMVTAIAAGVTGLKDIARDTYFFEVALGVLTAALLAMAPAAWAAMAPFITAAIPFLAFGAVLFMIIGLIDDLIVLFRGGDSVIGEFIDSLFGVGTAKQYIDDLKMSFQHLGDYWKDTIIPILSDFSTAVIEAAKMMQTEFKGAFDYISETVLSVEKELLNFSSSVMSGLSSVASFLGADEIAADLKAGADSAASAFHAVEKPEGQSRKTEMPSIFNPPIVNNSTTQTINVSVEGNATPETAGKVADSVARTTKNANRAAAQALSQGAA